MLCGFRDQKWDREWATASQNFQLKRSEHNCRGEDKGELLPESGLSVAQEVFSLHTYGEDLGECG